MYRNAWYDNRKGEINLWAWDSTGKRIKEVVPFEPYLYIESQSHKDAVSIYNTNLRKMVFKKQWDRHRFVEDSNLKRIFYNIPVEQQFLIENYRHCNTSLDATKNPLKIFYIDIETYSPGAFPEPKYAKDPINVITVYDSLVDHYFTWGLRHDFKPTLPNSTYIKCSTEKELLLNFIKYWRKDFPDIVSGWNIESFDIPYIINRITNLFDDDKAKELSPVGQLWCKEGVIKRFGKVESKWMIKGISVIDYMELYKINSRQQQEAYSLGYIGEAELGIGKIKIAATNLSSSADTDWQQFVEYNINDVYIVERLENKLQFLSLTRMLAYTGLANFEQALGTISIVTGAMAAEALKKGQIIATFNHRAEGDYVGGFVMDPIRGMNESIVSFDVNSLYPNTIVTLNLSPETKLGKVNYHENGKVGLSLINGKTYDVAEDKFAKFLKEKNISLSKSNVLFSQKTKGICPSLIDDVYKQRVITRQTLKDVKKNLNKIKDKSSTEYIEQKFLSDQLDVKQYTLKIFLNRIYGTYANKHSPFYDLDLASSITVTGQECIKAAGYLANTYLDKLYDINGRDCVLYSDTDSLYLTIDPVLKKINKTLTLDGTLKITPEAYKIVNDLESYLNQAITDWAKAETYSTDSRLQFKREAICDAGIFLQKKRYILHILDEEGIPCDKTKYVGVAVASTNVPKPVKPLIKTVIETMIKTKSKDATNKAFAKAYDDFKKMKIEDISFPKGINSFGKYAKNVEGLQFIKKTPIGVKASIAYNYFLDKLNLSNKYEKIRGGGKVKFFYATKNPWKIDTVAFIDEYPKEFQLRPDIDLMFEKLVVSPVEQLYKAVNWRMAHPAQATQTDLFELLG